MFDQLLNIIIALCNVLTIASLIAFSGYMHAESKNALNSILFTWIYIIAFPFRLKKIKESWIKDKINFCLHILIPICMGIALILISQFHDGALKIRWDIQIILSAALWIIMLIKEKTQHDLICKLYDTIKELRDRLSKYEK